jgi:hypothetical protein
MSQLLALADKGVTDLIALQKKVLGDVTLRKS